MSLFSAKAQKVFSGGDNPLNDMSAVAGLHGATMFYAGLLNI